MFRWWWVLWLAAGPVHAGKKKNKRDPAPVPAPVEAPAPSSAERVTLPCDWAEGAAFHYRYRRTREDPRQPEMSGVTSTTPVVVEVLASGPSTRFRYDEVGDTAYEGPEAAVKARRAMEAVEGPALELVMRDGAIAEVANLDEVRPVVEEMVRGQLPEPGPEAEATLRRLFDDPTALNAILLGDVGKLFSLHCVSVPAEGELVSPASYPNPLGGPPLAGRSVLRVGPVDAGARTVTFHTEDALDPQATRAALEPMMRQVLPEGVPITDAMVAEVLAKMPPIDHRMTGTMVYSLDDGFPLRVEIHQAVGAEGHPMRRADTWTWERVDPPAEGAADPGAEAGDPG